MQLMNWGYWSFKTSCLPARPTQQRIRIFRQRWGHLIHLVQAHNPFWIGFLLSRAKHTCHVVLRLRCCVAELTNRWVTVG